MSATSSSGCSAPAGRDSRGEPMSGRQSTSSLPSSGPVRWSSTAMPDLDFTVSGVEAVPYAMTPTLALKLSISNNGAERIHAVLLECQVRIEAQRRRYNESEKERLVDIFGEPDRWAQTLRSLLWPPTASSVPGFQ